MADIFVALNLTWLKSAEHGQHWLVLLMPDQPIAKCYILLNFWWAGIGIQPIVPRY